MPRGKTHEIDEFIKLRGQDRRPQKEHKLIAHKMDEPVLTGFLKKNKNKIIINKSILSP